MTPEDLKSAEDAKKVEDAKKIIGKSVADDWRITPTRHPAELEKSAPALYARLAHSSRAGVAERYERYDKEAIEAQTEFKQTASNANASVLAVACVGGLVAALGAYSEEFPGPVKVALAVFGATSVLAGGLATMWLGKLREAKLLDGWMKNRAKAEIARNEYFEKVTAPTADLDLALLQLEYFRRYQLDVQRAYYEGRGKQHRRAAAQNLSVRSFLALAGTVATGVAGAAGVFGPQKLAIVSLAALAVIAAALGSYAMSHESINQDARNGERYEKTSESLSTLHERLDDVRAAVAAGDYAVLEAFVKAVNEELSLEHRQWLAQSERWASALAELEKRLENAKKPPDDDPASAAKALPEAS